MTFISLEDAQHHLAELIDKLLPGEEKILTRDGQPVARLQILPKPCTQPRKLGTQPGSIVYMADDFDAPMDFKDSKE